MDFKSLIAIAIVGAVLTIEVKAAGLTPEQTAKLKELREVCVKETQVDPQLIDDAKKGKFADDAKLKAFLVCLSKKIGLVNEAGEIQKDVLKAKAVQVLGDEAIADKLREECSIKKPTLEDTVFESLKCVYEKKGNALLI